MSDSQTAWTVLWNHAASMTTPGAPFEIDEVAPAVALELKIGDPEARHLIAGLLTELDRMPEGKRYFRREGNAVVPLPSFTRARAGTSSPLDLYPYEL